MEIVMDEDRLYLDLNGKKDFSREDYKKIGSFLKMDKKNKKIEIDFGSALFEITDLEEKLIKRSCLCQNKRIHIVLHLRKYDLPNRIACLHYLRKLNIDNYKVSYSTK